MKIYKKNQIKVEGFTLIELLVIAVLATIIVGAIVSIYLVSAEVFRKNRPLSDVIEEIRSGITTLDFVFSRWGVGVPCKNNSCPSYSTTISSCDGYPPTNPMCMTCEEGNFSSGCSKVMFYANLYGIGFVVNATNDTISLVSCRLDSKSPYQNFYYIWTGEKVINYNSTLPTVYGFKSKFSSIDCINFAGTPNLILNSRKMCKYDRNLNSYNCNESYILKPGDLITRVPHQVRIFLEDEAIKMELYDLANNQTEGKQYIANAKSFQVYVTNGTSVKVKVNFKSQSNPTQTLEIERYFGR
ncbi:MAG: Uncharacterized protein XD55_1137 [Thermodesulfobacterium commune]|jgi:hypothetical protein|nr:MAG: Uncharacterized protein XD55_1137 [Thermodesulfobacterium commune]